MRKKCFRGLAQLYRVKEALPCQLRKLLYQSLILPHLDYCAVVWAECSKADEVKMERLQNQGMRLILNKGRDVPSRDLRSTLGWMTSRQRRKLLRARVVKRCLSGECPRYLSELCVTTSTLGLRSARRGNDLHLPTPRSRFVIKSFTYKAGVEWNEMPRSIRESNGTKFMSDLSLYYSS